MADFNELRLRSRVAEQREAAVRETRPVDRMVMRAGRPEGAGAPDFDDSTWVAAGPGAIWGGDEPWAWFRIGFRPAPEWAGQKVRLALPLGGQGMLYLDGLPWQGIDEYHRTTVLPDSIFDGKAHLAAIECYAAGAITAPRRPDETFIVGSCRLELVDREVEAFAYDLQVGSDALRVLPDASPDRAPLFELLLQAENLIDRRRPGSEQFRESVRRARALLAEGLPRLAARSAPGRPRIVAVGHAHIDTAWLWPLAQTRRKVARSWSTALRLMERFPQYHFVCSQPQQYAWLEQDEPDLYRQIVARIEEGRWEPAGALWVEPDGNLPSGESWVRQLLHGQGYWQRQFGRRSPIVWLPDSFGYSAALPQLLRSAGVHTIVTSKLSWNATNRMPHDSFRWRGLDGSEIMSYFITAGVDPRAESWANDPDAPQIGMATYNGHMTAPELMGAWTRYRDKNLNDEILYPFGWGDGGGGPTEEMLEFAARVDDYPGMPRLEQSSAEDLMTRIHDRIWDNPRTAVWEGELYLEYHRGTYTSQAGVKWGNRRAEHALHDAELWAAWAAVLGADTTSWRATLAEAWQTVLLNQFHDILPGSSIAEVYVDQGQDHERVLRQAGEVGAAARRLILEHAATSRPALALFSGLPWARTGAVELALDLPSGEQILDVARRALSAQQVQGRDGAPAVLLDGVDLPPLGLALLPRGSGAATAPALLSVSERVLENRFFRLELDEYGEIASLLDKRHDRQVLLPSGGGNALVAFEDKPISYDAWDIDGYYVEKPTPLQMVDEWLVVEEGPVRAGVEIVRRWEGSTIRQRILLYASMPLIEFQTHIDWHHRQVLLKAAFPLAVHNTQASYEVAFGHVQRPTHRNTSWDAARFEVSGHRWADLSEADYGVSLLNDGKYGHDCLGSMLRLTLLKSGIMPDPLADEGAHRFSYALLPHGPGWSIADTVREAYAFNLPACGMLVDGQRGEAPAPGSLVSSTYGNAVVDTVKVAEDGDGLIVRVYECANGRGPVALRFAHAIASAQSVTILEEPDAAAGALDISDAELRFTLSPFQVRTFRIRLRA